MSVYHQLNNSYTSNWSLAMTFSADGTGHCNINYNSHHVNLRAEDYDGTGDTPKQVMRFLGVMPSLDGTSEQSIKDWEKTLENITDIFNRSPLGKKYGQLTRTVDFFAKLAGMMTDHCAKEKKDVMELEKKKIDAMYQKLGEGVVLDSSNANLLPKFLDAHKEMIKTYGGPDKWGTLSENEQKERVARMTETVVVELGKEAYEMLSDSEKRALKLFIWAGCGCHKDLIKILSRQDMLKWLHGGKKAKMSHQCC